MQKDFGSLLSSFGKGDLANFRSQFPIFVRSVGIKSFAEQVLKSFWGRNNFPEPPVFRFTNSLPYSLKESRKLRIRISCVLG